MALASARRLRLTSKRRRLPMNRMRHAYLGPEISGRARSKRRSRPTSSATRSLNDPAATAAELLAAGKIVGWFQGRMEFGPRALGTARSWPIRAIRK